MNPCSEQWLAEVVGEIYQSAFDLDQLAKVLDRIRLDLDSDGYLMRMQNQADGGVAFGLASGHEESWVKAYKKHFHKVDPYPALMRDFPVGITLGDCLTTDRFLHSEYYNDFLKPQHRYYCVGGHLLKNKHYFVMLAFQRNRERQGFEEREARLLNHLTPHFQKILQLNQQMHELNTQNLIAEQVLGCMTQGVIVLGEGLEVLFMNRAAEEILAGDHGVKLTSFGVVTPVTAESRQLSAMIRQALQLAAGSGDLPKNSMLITPMRVDLHPLQAMVMPLRPESRKIAIFPARPKALLVLSTLDRSGNCKAKIEVLKNLYGLTGTEAHLVQELVAGRELEEAALDRGVSMHTVRNQLKAVFAKTGIRRQVDLIRLVLTMPGHA
ncbi:MAG: hypothetical protein HQM03_07765 [Magnetococcales bacterium]|nr:hypothetical protein [Magnetococcales bacterium]